MEEMTIRYRTENPIGDKRADHAHSIKIRIQEMLASFGNFFIAMYTNEDTQRLTFAQISKLKVDCMIFESESWFVVPNVVCYNLTATVHGCITRLSVQKF